MKIKVAEDLCIGCGICEGIAPEVFSLETEPYAVVLLDPIPEEFQDAVREAAESCPEAAIEIEESTGDFYLALARMAKIHEVRDAFRWLAMEDIRHAQTLCSLINPDGTEGGDAARPDGEPVA